MVFCKCLNIKLSLNKTFVLEPLISGGSDNQLVAKHHRRWPNPDPSLLFLECGRERFSLGVIFGIFAAKTVWRSISAGWIF